MLRRSILALFLCSLVPGVVHGQRHSPAVSEMEEEKIRDAAAEPARRIVVYQEIIETRIRRIQTVLADKRAQGRRDDLQQNMEEISGLIDEFQNNLEEYDAAHRDLRKPLPKLQDALLRWDSVLRQPPADEGYELTRKLALEAVADVKAEVTEMIPAQAAYFKAHPPDKDANPGGVGSIRHE